MQVQIPQSFELDWKEYGVDLGLAVSHIKSLSPSVKSYTGEKALVLWLSAPLSDQEKSDIQSYWDSLSEEHDHCKDYKNFAERKAALEAGRQSAANKSWDSMSVAERKLVMNLELSSEEIKSLE